MSGSQHSGLSVDQEVDFVNREIDRHLDVWKNRSDRSARDMAPVVALSAAFISASAVLLATGVRDQERFTVSSIPFLLFLSTSGLFLACRITRRSIQSTVDMLRVEMLRSYFVDRSEVLRQYVPPRHVTVSDLQSALQNMHDRGLERHGVKPVLAACSGLNGVTAGIVAWWVLEPVVAWTPLLVGGAAAVFSLPSGWRYVRHVQRRAAWRVASALGVELSSLKDHSTQIRGKDRLLGTGWRVRGGAEVDAPFLLGDRVAPGGADVADDGLDVHVPDEELAVGAAADEGVAGGAERGGVEADRKSVV